MGKQIKVEVIIGAKRIPKTYEEGVTYEQVAKEVQSAYSYPIILARRGGKLVELNKRIREDVQICFMTTADDSGHKTYVRGVTLLMLRAFYAVCKGQPLENVYVKYQIGDSCYCEVSGVPVTESLLQQVEQYMKELVHRDIPFLKRSVDTSEALRIFEKYGMMDKKKLFEYRRVSKVNIYTLDGFEDYYYGYMPASTGVLQYFSLEPYENGFMLNLPNSKTPDQTTLHKPSPKLFATLQEAKSWGKMVDVDTVGALNDVISHGGAPELILVQEALQEKKIAQIAEQIANDPSKKFVMIAGPSSSGKTSFSHRLSIQLRTLGVHPHPIALDNYFVDRDETPLDENGNYNFECLEAIDVKLFNQQMNELLAGKRVELPTFNFVTGQKEYKGDYKQLGEDDILVIEGIHGLNDKLSYTLPKESKFKIYISALTQINIDEHNRIPTTDGRLIRRIVRDNRTRGHDIERTLSMWQSVRQGEEQYIFPYEDNADVMFNSGLLYEYSVLKKHIEPLLMAVGEMSPYYSDVLRLKELTDRFLPLEETVVPLNSILREFIGGGCFKV